MVKILVSACLIGEKVRYDGTGKDQNSNILDAWREADMVVPICPEVAGGLGTPRPPAEITSGDGHDVLSGKARVKTKTGEDVSGQFKAGAALALQLAEKHKVAFAVLKARSPSCGNVQIYAGKFDKSIKDGQGVTAALLEEHGIRVFNEAQFEEAEAFRLALSGSR